MRFVPELHQSIILTSSSPCTQVSAGNTVHFLRERLAGFGSGLQVVAALAATGTFHVLLQKFTTNWPLAMGSQFAYSETEKHGIQHQALDLLK